MTILFFKVIRRDRGLSRNITRNKSYFNFYVLFLPIVVREKDQKNDRYPY